MSGFVTLDGRAYTVTDPKQISRSNANQVAAKIGSGAGDYDDLQNWNAWLQEDWRAGVGKKDPEAGGFLAATLDSRFGNQLTLNQHTKPNIYHEPTSPYSPAYNNALETPYDTEDTVTIAAGTTITIGAEETYKYLAYRLGLDVGETLNRVEIWLPGSDNTDTITVELWSNVAGEPYSVLGTTTITLNGRVGQFWYLAEFPSTQAPSVLTSYWLVIYPSDQLSSDTLTVHTNETISTEHASYNGSAWVASTTSFMARCHCDALTTPITKSVIFSNLGLFIASGENLYTGNYALITTFAADITDMLALGDTLYIGLGDTEVYYTMSVGLVTTAGTVPARLWAAENGYLWRAVLGSVYYSGDAVTWTTIDVADSGYLVRGLAGLAGELIVSTDNGLYRIVSGDVVLNVTHWGYPTSTNGAHMLNFQGQLYITQNESLIRFDGETMLPYGPDLDEGLAVEFAGDIVALAANNNWLLAAVAGSEGSVWAHNGQGWHQLVRLPEGATLTCIDVAGADRLVTTFTVGTAEGMVYTVFVTDTKKAIRRVNDVNNSVFFEFFGWLETDWFYGGLREVDKDWESIYVDGENISETSYAEVYWEDSDSLDWELLGTVTSPTQELRWSDSTTRPNSRRLKVGIALYNSQQRATPVVTAVRVKYMPMVTDRWRWMVPIEVSDYVELPDGSRSPHEIDSVVAHLDSLTKRVAPFIFIDTDGKQFEVKVMNASRSPSMYEYEYAAAATHVLYRYSLVLEQVTADEYTP